jgi:hypothetical protein
MRIRRLPEFAVLSFVFGATFLGAVTLSLPSAARFLNSAWAVTAFLAGAMGLGWLASYLAKKVFFPDLR